MQDVPNRAQRVGGEKVPWPKPSCRTKGCGRATIPIYSNLRGINAMMDKVNNPRRKAQGGECVFNETPLHTIKSFLNSQLHYQ